MNNEVALPHSRLDMQRPGRRQTGWLIPAGLVLLSLIPAIAGTSRLAQLAGGAEVTSDNARFFAAPLPVVLHIISAVIYSLLGAFQFSPGFRQRNRGWHRVAGRVLVVAGLVTALSGLWMTQFYPSPQFDGATLYAMRLVVGTAMAVSLCLGMTTILKGDVQGHEAWMMRGYALGLGAGTQVLTHIPWFLFPAIQGELARTLFMAAGWGINLAVAEWIIARKRRRLMA